MADDYAGNTSTGGTVSVGGSRGGSIEITGDTDWFAVNLAGGATYRFDLKGADTGDGTLPDPFLRLRDGGGNSITSDDDSGTGLNARIGSFVAPSSGTYYLSVGSATTSGTGTYTLSVTQTSAPTSADDYAGNTSTSGSVHVGGSSSGSIEAAGDTDWFAVSLTSGATYQFDLEGADTGDGSLADPFLRLRDGSGNSITSDDDGGTGLNARIGSFTAPSSGVYYLSVGSATSSGTGTYSLSVTETAPPAPADDYSASTSTDGIVSVGGSQTGEIEVVGDTDWFRVTLTAGSTYAFDLEGADFGHGTLPDPFLRLRDSGGASITDDDDSGAGLDSHIVFTAQQGGDYYLSVGSAVSGGVGTYRLSVEDITPDANAAPIISGPSTVEITTGQVVSGETLFGSASDSDGQVAYIRFWDSSPGAGGLAYDGSPITGSYIDVTPANLDRLTYQAGNTAGSNDIVVEAYDDDGADSNDLYVHVVVSEAAANTAPVIDGPGTIALTTGQVLAGSGLFSHASDSDGAIAYLRFWDSTPGAGYLAFDGVKISGSHIDVTPSQLGRLTYVAGTSAGSNDIVIEAFDGSGQSSNDLQVRLTVSASGENHAPVISGPASVNFTVNQTVAATQLFGNFSDSDGSVERIRIWDSTPGAGYLALDGAKITGSYVDIAVSDLSRLTYKTGSQTGSNEVLIEVFDNGGADSNDLLVHINVAAGADTTPVVTGPNRVIPYVDPTPGAATPAEIVAIARTYVAAQQAWGPENCTGFVWLVADQAGARFFDQESRYTDDTHTRVVDAGVQLVYDVPGIGDDDKPDGWALRYYGVDWTAHVSPGDLVRLNMNGSGGVHSFIVSKVDGQGADRKVWVIDNSQGFIHEYLVDGYRVDGSRSTFEADMLHPIRAWVHTLSSVSQSPQDTVAQAWSRGSEVRQVTGGSGVDVFKVQVQLDGADSLAIGADGQGQVIVADADTHATLVSIDDFEEVSVEGGAGADKLKVGALAGTDIAHSTVLIYSGDGNDVVDGGAADRRLVVSAGMGDDIVTGGHDGDSLVGDAGNDSLSGGAGNDTLTGGAGNDILNGGEGVDTASYDGSGAIKVDLSLSGAQNTSRAGTDTLISIENLTGSSYSDNLTGSGGANVIKGVAGADLIDGGGGNDTLYGGIGADVLHGGAGADLVYGDDSAGAPIANDKLFGDAGDDILRGYGGNDQLTGGAGADRLYGGTGADKFIYAALQDSTAAARDKIYDLNPSEGDRIDLRLIDARTDVAGDQAFALVSKFDGHSGEAVLSWSSSSNVTTLTLDVDGDKVADFYLSIVGHLDGTSGFIL